MPAVDMPEVPLNRHLPHQQQLDLSRLPADSMRSCEYVYAPTAAIHASDGGSSSSSSSDSSHSLTHTPSRSSYVFLEPCWLWDAPRRVLWKVRVNVADIAAVTHDPRSCIGFLRRRGQVRMYMKVCI